MEVKINYNECLTNVICSIQKYFGVEYKHSSLKMLDDILDRKQPENVVLMLFDGMGDNIILRNLDKDEYFIKHRIGRITSVFPPTTTAATSTTASGLNPSEHGWLGWNTYIPAIDKTVVMFLGRQKETDELVPEYPEAKKEYIYREVTVAISEDTPYEGIEVSPFTKDPVHNLDELFERTTELCLKPGKKYLYVYNNNPDHIMHELGPDHPDVIENIRDRQRRVEEMMEKLDNTVLIVIADHGHIKVNNVFIKDYPDFAQTLERTTSIEPRAISFKVKENCKDTFEKLFKLYFEPHYSLYTRQDVLDSELFGPATKIHPRFVDELGDYIGIANDEMCLMNDDDYPLYSQHAGYTDDEIYVPLIVVEK